MTVKNEDIINDFMKETIKNLSLSVRSSFDLPTKGTSEESIFNDFPQYKKVVNGLSLKILTNIQNLIDKQDGKGNILDTGEKKALEDKFSILVEVNDRLLDRCNNLISSIEHPEYEKPSPVVMVEYQSEGGKLKGSGGKMTPQQTIKLLSSIQIERPQLKFKRQPDNSDTPFRPLLSSKPNSLRPLVNYSELKEDSYDHPYEFEIDNLVIPVEHMAVEEGVVEPPGSLEDTRFVFVDTAEALGAMVEELRVERAVAVDVEHHSVRSYLGLTCLLQLSSGTTDYLVDTLALRDSGLEALNAVMTDPRVCKVFHGANSDVMWLQRDCGIYVVNMFDTGLACTELGLPRRSLAYLLERYCQVRANKEYQRLTDWRLRPLVAELVEYARTDTHYLLYIFRRMKQELRGAGRSVAEVFEGSRRLCRLTYRKPRCCPADSDSRELLLKSREQFNGRQLFALRRLWRLRDRIAREEDESPLFVLPNQLLLAIAQALPRERAGVLACCSQDWRLPLLRKYVFDFQIICLQAYEEDASVTAASVAMEGDSPHMKKNKNTSVLQQLLCRHDTTKEDYGSEAVTETSPRHTALLYSNSSSSSRQSRASLPDDLVIVKTFLDYHPVTHHTSKDTEVTLTTEPTLTAAAEEAGEHEHGVLVQDLTVEDPPTVAEAAAEGEAVECMEQRPAKKRKVQVPVVPFDYEASLEQLRQNQSNSDNNKGKKKSFNPFVTKKFNKKKGKK